MTNTYLHGLGIRNMSPDILNKQIRLMADFVLRAMLSDIRTSTWLSILADEATDVKFNEQMCVAIRWVDEVYEVQEGPFGMDSSTKDRCLYINYKLLVVRCSIFCVSCTSCTSM